MAISMPITAQPEQVVAANIDARPILPLAGAGLSLWDSAEKTRDELAHRIDGFFRSRRINARVQISQPGVYPLEVDAECWIPAGESSVVAKVARSALSIRISVDPYRENPMRYDVSLNRHGRVYTSSYWRLSMAEVTELLVFLLDGGRKPDFFRSRTPFILALIAAFVPFFDVTEKNRLIPEARPSWFTLPTVLFFSGLTIAAMLLLSSVYDDSYDGSSSGLSLLLAIVVLIGSSIASYKISHRRTVLQAVPKQPVRCPRRERLIDTWHVSVPDAGDDFDAFKQRIYAVARATDQGVHGGVEIHENPTPRGFESRERLVLTMGQATLHVHVQRFGRDAFVGWDSHLNWRRWAEGDIESRTVVDRSAVEYRTLKVGIHVPTEFDLMEANVLSETTHLRIVNEIKSFLKEREIEADLDFRIIRGDRANALDRDRNAPPDAQKA
jgi:hypothetical protein